MNIVSICEDVERERCRRDAKANFAERRFCRLPSVVLTAILVTKTFSETYGAKTGNTEPTEDELRQLWNILKEAI